MVIDGINPKCFLPSREWERPKLGEVEILMDILGWPKYIIALRLSLNKRTVRRWHSDKVEQKNEKSSISYCDWAILTYFATGFNIITPVKEIDLPLEMSDFIVSSSMYESPPKNILRSFVGINSLTGLTRTKFSSLLHLDGPRLGRNLNGNGIKYSQWCCFLWLIGVPFCRTVFFDEENEIAKSNAICE